LLTIVNAIAKLPFMCKFAPSNYYLTTTNHNIQMKKEKFKYNPETLSYEKVEVTWSERILRSLLVIGPAVVLAFIFQLVFAGMFQSPYEKELETENAFLNSQLDKMNTEVALAMEVLEDISDRDNEIYRVVFNAEPFPEEIRQMEPEDPTSMQN
jgi:hypothetical protein